MKNFNIGIKNIIDLLRYYCSNRQKIQIIGEVFGVVSDHIVTRIQPSLGAAKIVVITLDSFAWLDYMGKTFQKLIHGRSLD